MDSSAPDYSPRYDPEMIRRLRRETDDLRDQLAGKTIIPGWQIIIGGWVTGSLFTGVLITIMYGVHVLH